MHAGNRWGYLITRWHDQGRVAHLLRDDNGPACGARYYASAGASTPAPDSSACCRRCLRIARGRLGT